MENASVPETEHIPPIETEQELLTTAAELKEQFNEIKANCVRENNILRERIAQLESEHIKASWVLENNRLRERIARLESEQEGLGVSRCELDRQAGLLDDAREIMKTAVRELYGWDYAINLASWRADTSVMRAVLDHVRVDIEAMRATLARAVKYRLRPNDQNTYTGVTSPEFARSIRLKFAKDLVSFKANGNSM